MTKNLTASHFFQAVFLVLFFLTNQGGFGVEKAYAQVFSAQDYQPINLPDRIPTEVLDRIKGNLAINLSKEENQREQQFGVITTVELRKIFSESHVYYGDTMSAYVRLVLDKLLAKDPVLRKKLYPFVTRFSSANAMTWQDGTILVNIGLLQKCENEAQLAFVLAHELTHFKLKHSLQEFIRGKNEQPKSISASIATIPYPDDNELIADSLGLSMMEAAGYDGQEAIAMLRILEKNTPENTLNLIDALSSEKSQLTQNDLCSNAGLRDYSAGMNDLVAPNGKKLIGFNQRIARLQRYQKTNEQTQKQYLLDPVMMRYIKRIADNEAIENSRSSCDYVSSAFQALQKLEKEPNNKYYAHTAAKNLVQILIYSKNGSLGGLIERKAIRDAGLAQFACFIAHTKDNILQQILFGKIESITRSFTEKDEDMLFCLAEANEVYNGLDMALVGYKNYNELFPTGKYIVFVKNKLGIVNLQTKPR